jgi:hypothetical protein
MSGDIVQVIFILPEIRLCVPSAAREIFFRAAISRVLPGAVSRILLPG